MSTAYNAQFFQLDFRLLDDPDFLTFLRKPASALYFLLVRHIWRGGRHAIARVNELRREGLLVAALDRGTLVERLGLADKRYVSKMLAQLEKRGLIERRPTGRQPVYVLGTWEDKSHAGDDSCIVEVLYLHQHFGPDRRPQIRLDEGEGVSQANSGLASEANPEPGLASQANSGLASQAKAGLASQAKAFLIDKGIDKTERSEDLSLPDHTIPPPRPKNQTEHQRKLARLAELLESRGRQPPKPNVLGHWLKNLCNGDFALAVATLERLGRQGHLADKPDEYLFAALARAGRDAAARSQAAAPQTTLYEDDDDDEGVYVVRLRPAAGAA